MNEPRGRKVDIKKYIKDGVFEIPEGIISTEFKTVMLDNLIYLKRTPPEEDLYFLRDDIPDNEVKKIVFPKSLVSVGSFFYIDGVEKLVFKGNNIELQKQAFACRPKCKPEDHALKTVIFENGAHTIGAYAFFHFRNLTSVEGTVKHVKYSAFGNCTNLKNFNFSKVETIGVAAFGGCALERVSLNENCKILDNRAFEDCKNLKFVKCKAEEIRTNCFKGCKKLKSVKAENLELLEAGAFFGCPNLTTLDLSNSSILSFDTNMCCASIAKYGGAKKVERTVLLPPTLQTFTIDKVSNNSKNNFVIPASNFEIIFSEYYTFNFRNINRSYNGKHHRPSNHTVNFELTSPFLEKVFIKKATTSLGGNIELVDGSEPFSQYSFIIRNEEDKDKIHFESDFAAQLKMIKNKKINESFMINSLKNPPTHMSFKALQKIYKNFEER